MSGAANTPYRGRSVVWHTSCEFRTTTHQMAWLERDRHDWKQVNKYRGSRPLGQSLLRYQPVCLWYHYTQLNIGHSLFTGTSRNRISCACVEKNLFAKKELQSRCGSPMHFLGAIEHCHEGWFSAAPWMLFTDPMQPVTPSRMCWLLHRLEVQWDCETQSKLGHQTGFFQPIVCRDVNGIWPWIWLIENRD